jgi:hypothetical protein
VLCYSTFSGKKGQKELQHSVVRAFLCPVRVVLVQFHNLALTASTCFFHLCVVLAQQKGNCANAMLKFSGIFLLYTTLTPLLLEVELCGVWFFAGGHQNEVHSQVFSFSLLASCPLLDLATVSSNWSHKLVWLDFGSAEFPKPPIQML